MNPINDMAASTWLRVAISADDSRTTGDFPLLSTACAVQASNGRFQAPNNRGLSSERSNAGPVQAA
jgi:hypothetical protein